MNGQQLPIDKTRSPQVKVCGLTRIDEALKCVELGVNAIGFAQRGIDRITATPFVEASETCIGCGSCVYVCPTGYIKMTDKDGKRYIENWKVELELQSCENCGAYIAPKRQLDYIRSIADLPSDFYNLCFDCR